MEKNSKSQNLKISNKIFTCLILGFIALASTIVSPTSPIVSATETETPTYVFPPDDRRLVTASQAKTFPYSGIVKLVTTFERADANGNRRRGCSGAVIASNKVLTAAHCLYTAELGNAVAIAVVPGQTAGIQPFGIAQMKSFEILDQEYINYVNSGQNGWQLHDVGIITLDRNIGNTTGKFGYTNQIDTNQTYTTTGYPGDKSEGADMYTTSGKISVPDPNQSYISTYIDIFGGQSGSPIYNSSHQIVGIISAEDREGRYPNTATRLTANHVAKINASIQRDQPVDKGEALYRLYNPNTGLHFYTKSAHERDSLVRLGWKSEGIAWYSPRSGAPVYRLYNPNQGTHHFTTSEGEKNHLVGVGWKYEGVAFYSGGNVTVYRMYNPHTGEHFYTLNTHERDHLVKVGWKYEGVGFKAQNVG